MMKKVIVSGLLGAGVLIVWMFVVNGVFGFKGSIDRKPILDERRVYECLKGSIVEPGRYICNPELDSSGSFPGEEPVFGIYYSGMGHESAGKLMLVQLALFVLAPTIAAWMLSLTSERTVASYPRKVLFFAAMGLLFAVFGDLMRFGIDSYSLNDALMLAVHDIMAWTLVGLVVAWRMQPEPGTATHPATVRA
jgi:hypothetical protein